MLDGIIIARLARSHQYQEFNCGVDALNEYLKKRAMQDMRRNAAVTFVMLKRSNPNFVIGYYSLASTSIRLQDLPKPIIKKLPHYPTIPATLLGRLALAKQYQSHGLGALLLMDALKRSFKLSQEVASFAVIVDAIDADAKSFYEYYGFQILQANMNRLYLMTKTIAELF